MKRADPLPFTVRAFDEARDYQGRAEVHNASFPDRQVTVEELESWDRSADPDPKYLNRHLVVELSQGGKEEGRLVAHLWYGHWPSMYHPQKPYFSLAVHPDFRKHGIGSTLYEKMLTGIALSGFKTYATADR